MEIRQLRYAVLLDEHRHFGRAARAAFITQPAFSQQIASLERELDVSLFERSQSGTRPTAAGERFLDHARGLLEGLRELETDLRAIAAGSQGALRVGLFGASAGEITPLLIDTYRTMFPGVDLTFHELSMTRQFDELRDRDVDVAIVHPLCEADDIEFDVLFHEPRYAAVPIRNELADASSVSVEDLVDLPFVVAGDGTPGAWRSFWAYGEESDATRRARAKMQTIAEGLAAVAYLNVVDTVPATVTRYHRHPGVAFVPVEDATFSSVAVARRANETSPIVKAFCHVADHVAGEHHAMVPGAVRPAGTQPR